MNPPINILIVDDEPTNLTVLEAILDHPGYRLIRAQSPDQALLALIDDEFALIILDIRMPGMTGFELANMIKERKKTAQVPIIFLTAYYNEDQHILTGYDAGAVDYLHKPVNAHILRSKVAVFAELFHKSRAIEVANRTLLAEVAERRRAEERLLELNATLEERVLNRTEALRDADRRKDEFLATLAHELRNPLAPVRNAIELLQLQGPATPELQWAKDVIERQMQTMTRLIDDLMDMSRVSQGKIELKRELVELSKVLQFAVESSRPLIEECNHLLTVKLPPYPVIVNGDFTRLSQVFLNLLNNAAKYMEPGGRIEISAEQQTSDVIVVVRDNGIGIPAANLPSIFEMFSQVESALSRSRGGLGIGLYLAKRLVAKHGGYLSARSDGPGKGSEFVVRLPLAVERNDTSATGEFTDMNALRSNVRVLVVDDNQDAAMTAKMLLQMMGNAVRTAHDGEAAIAEAEEFRPDVVLCDIGLPKKNGYEVARAIREQPWGKNIILIAVTGWGQEDDKCKSQEAGFDRHMVKPVEPLTLMKMIAELDVVNGSRLPSDAH
jgi:signal transduction histidine kinase